MLDSETKRRIDTARDILVGKVPDPKSQVEQITIALIYKFMDDMDAEVEELGGDRSFFAGEFAKYGWGRLMSPSVGGHELLNLYSEGISTMPQNVGIPALFRDIFKNAYLPYRDPETLKSFLKVIDGFTYDHSERLGDAFEYLLSVLGSQGDAGQFRTPRHIIDFMVEVLRPQKGEVILDPACGTAGFLISAYKHILRNNQDTQGNSTLTPDEKGLMATNFKGYDISPDMVRLSLVNLYLHGFKSPQIVEYDTLTSEDRWNEFADVILANPPFMSPKGGIKPHKRFSIKAKRSEVLFVDYMAEHLSPRGRAGIIVPEGIIFQSQTAYKDLRKMLVENSLVAVISLPAGVFNPYSGVKTSILILDKSLAKKTDKIAFFKVENDGFGLGAQRREVSGGQLSQVQVELAEYLQAVRNQVSTDDLLFPLGLIVPKEKVAANGEYNLSGERYRENSNNISQKYPMIELEEVCEIKAGGTPSRSEKEYWNGTIPWIGSTVCKDSHVYQAEEFITEEGMKNSSAKLFLAGTTLIALVGATIGKTGLLKFDSTTNQNIAGLYPKSSEILDNNYLFHVSQSLYPEFMKLGEGKFRMANLSFIRSLKIPLPPIAIQQEIVTEIEGYQKVINGARAVIDNYRPHIAIEPDWEMIELGKVCDSIMDGTHFSPSNTESGDRLYITSKNVRENYLDLRNVSYISEEDHQAIFSRCPVKKGDVLYIKDGANTGLAAINSLDEEFSLLSSVAVMRGKDEVLDNRYLVFYLNSVHGRQYMLSMISGVAITRLTLTKLNSALIPLPPIEIQKAIVAEIEAEQALVNANRELIESFEKKIQTVLNRIWGGE